MSNQDSFRIFIRVILPILSCGVFHSYHHFLKRKSLIMKNISTGFGLCAIAAAVALYPVLDRFAPIAKEAHAGVPVSAITSATLAQTAPTIVWYGSTAFLWNNSYQKYQQTTILRAWSDGKLEMRLARKDLLWDGGSGQTDNSCNGNGLCLTPWMVINDPNQGYSAASDSNFDSKVDSTDLAMLLGNWGDAPRHDIPPSDCPLNLINP